MPDQTAPEEWSDSEELKPSVAEMIEWLTSAIDTQTANQHIVRAFSTAQLTAIRDHLAAPQPKAMRSAQFDAAWNAITQNDALTSTRKRLSIDNLRTIINLILDAVENHGDSLYLSAVKGRMEFRDAYRSERDKRMELEALASTPTVEPERVNGELLEAMRSAKDWALEADREFSIGTAPHFVNFIYRVQRDAIASTQSKAMRSEEEWARLMYTGGRGNGM